MYASFKCSNFRKKKKALIVNSQNYLVDFVNDISVNMFFNMTDVLRGGSRNSKFQKRETYREIDYNQPLN